MAQIEEEKREHHNKMLKMEREMEEVFERKVKEKQRKLRDSETDLERRHKESMEKLEQQKRELEARISAFSQVFILHVQTHSRLRSFLIKFQASETKNSQS